MVRIRCESWAVCSARGRGPADSRGDPMRRLVTFLAWLSIVGSILALALILVARRSAIDHGSAAIFGWSDGRAQSGGGYGLTYHGGSGFSLAAAELVLITLAA